MEQLCQTYWYPLYVFVRRKGHNHEDASDLAQAYFARFLEKRYLKSVDADLGKFRTFLLTSMTHFLANEWDKSQAQKCGGGQRIISFDDASAEGRYRLEPVEHTTPETLFDRRWAETVVGVVIVRPSLHPVTRPHPSSDSRAVADACTALCASISVRGMQQLKTPIYLILLGPLRYILTDSRRCGIETLWNETRYRTRRVIIPPLGERRGFAPDSFFIRN